MNPIIKIRNIIAYALQERRILEIFPVINF